MSIIEFERHKVIYYEGDVGRIMYFVLSGEVIEVYDINFRLNY